MDHQKGNEYFTIKMDLLKQCQQLSEEFLSSLDDWESLSDILERREVILKQLKSHEDAYGEEVSSACSESQKHEIDLLIQLIVQIDQDAEKKIRQEQKIIMESLKANVQEQKFIQYGSIPAPQSGRLLDYKK